MEIKILIRVDHDNLENRNAATSEQLGLFIANGKLTAHGVAEKWILENLKNIDQYLGYDGQIYPQFEIKTEVTK